MDGWIGPGYENGTIFLPNTVCPERGGNVDPADMVKATEAGEASTPDVVEEPADTREEKRGQGGPALVVGKSVSFAGTIITLFFLCIM